MSTSRMIPEPPGRLRIAALRAGAPAAPPWYRIHAQADDTDTVRIDLYDSIGGWFGVLASEFVRDLVTVEASTIELHINSPGGDVYDGIAIMNALRQHDARVIATVDGLAASAASFIAVGGSDELVMARNSELMIHEAWGIEIGDAQDMARMAERLDKISDNLASIYSDKAGGKPGEWRAAMRIETWYSAAEAVTAGLADRVEPADADEDADSSAAARFDLSIFNYAGRAKAPKPPKPPAAPAAGPRTTPQERSGAVAFSDEQLTTMRRRLDLAAEADEDTIMAAFEQHLDTHVETPPTPPAPTLPAGVVAVEQATLEELRAQAQLGSDAHARQQSEDRERLVAAAVADGRVAPARRQHWLAQLVADPGAADTLASLEKGLIPVGPEIGHAGNSESDPATAENYWFPGVVTTRQES